MFVHRVGDLFTTSLPAIGHGVNTHGVMGSGIARIIAGRFPAVLAPYKEACATGALTPGGFQAVKVREDPDLFIFNLASQQRPGKDARLEWLEQSVEKAVSYAKENGFFGFALPRIGAGIGGLDWESEVRPALEVIADREDTLTIELWSLPDA